MGRLSSVIVCLFAFFQTGCSIHPIPDDLPGVSTVDIAHNIYCELHHALKKQVIIAFDESADPRAKAMGAELRAGTAQPWDKRANKATAYLDDRYKTRLSFFRGTDVGFAFRFRIVENDRLNTTADFTLPFTNTTFTLGLIAEKDKTRDNERRFQIEDNFQNVIYSEDCTAFGLKRKNYLYPISGSIGIDNMVQTFIDLLIEGAILTKSDIGHFSETLIFITKISGSVNPIVQIGSVAKEFRLTRAALDFDASREDLHQVQIVFTLTKDADRRLLAIRNRKLRPGITPVAVNPNISRQLNNLRILQNDQRIIDRLPN